MLRPCLSPVVAIASKRKSASLIWLPCTYTPAANSPSVSILLGVIAARPVAGFVFAMFTGKADQLALFTNNIYFAILLFSSCVQ